MSTGFSNNQSFVGHGNISDDLLNDDNNASESLPEMQLDAGLYDASNVQLASWDELVNVYGLDIDEVNELLAKEEDNLKIQLFAADPNTGDRKFKYVGNFK
jgi:hypothetical protein